MDLNWGKRQRVGQADGDHEYTFGDIRALAVDGNGIIYAYDAVIQELRVYDDSGKYLRTIGRTGSGPGEYRDIVGLTLHSDGSLMALDPLLQRIARYTSSGESLSPWRVPAGLYDSDMLHTDSTGRTYVKTMTGPIEPTKPWPIGLLVLYSTGAIVDTVHPPAYPDESADGGRYDPAAVWSWHLGGHLVSAFGARYAIDLMGAADSMLRIERAGQLPVRISAEEREDLAAVLRESRREPDEAGTATPIEVPGTKPLIRQLMTGADGRIWVRVHSQSISRFRPAEGGREARRAWIEDHVWDVFEPDGRFLGRLRFPAGGEPRVVRGDEVWGVLRDEDDLPFIVRWRIVVPED